MANKGKKLQEATKLVDRNTFVSGAVSSGGISSNVSFASAKSRVRCASRSM